MKYLRLYLVLLAIAGTGFGVWRWYWNSEIDMEDYEKLVGWKQNYPSFSERINGLAEDKKVVEKEFWKIEAAVHSYAEKTEKEKALSELNSKKDNLISQLKEK